MQAKQRLCLLSLDCARDRPRLVLEGTASSVLALLLSTAYVLAMQSSDCGPLTRLESRRMVSLLKDIFIAFPLRCGP